MEFFIFILILSSVSFSVAILSYGLCVRLFGVATTFSAKLGQWILTSFMVVGWDFLVITHTGTPRLILGFIPLAVLIGLLIYYKVRHGNDEAPEPHEYITKKKSTKSQKHAEKIRLREEARQQQ